MTSFEDLVLVFYIRVPNTTIEGAMKKNSNLNNIVTTFQHFTKKIMVLVY